MHCYCLDNFTKINKIEFEDGKNYCTEWLRNFIELRTLLYMPPLVIIMVNTMLKLILRKMVLFEKRRNLTTETMSSIWKMFLAQFINTAIILIVINGGISWITYSS